jgi:hypothetical protein
MAQAAYQRSTLPRYDDYYVAPKPSRAPSQRRRSVVRPAQHLLSRHLFAFVIVLALLGAGRVTLSFAVVQKSLQTGAAARETMRLTASNAHLSDQVAALSATNRIRGIAVNDLHLVPATNVRYLTVHTTPGVPGTLGR